MKLDTALKRQDAGQLSDGAAIAPRPGGSARALPVLRVAAGPDLLRFVALSPGEQAVIGRGEGADLPLGDPRIAPRHAQVICAPDGSLTVIALEGEVRAGGEVVRQGRIQVGDRLLVGPVPVVVESLSLPERDHVARVARRLQEPARDRLTGLLPPEAVEPALVAAVERSQGSASALSCVMVEIDGLERLPARGAVLSELARLVMAAVRGADACLRRGDDRVLVLLEGASAPDAARVAGRLRSALDRHDWTYTLGARRLNVRFGVAQRQVGEGRDAWLGRALEHLERVRMLESE